MLRYKTLAFERDGGVTAIVGGGDSGSGVRWEVKWHAACIRMGERRCVGRWIVLIGHPWSNRSFCQGADAFGDAGLTVSVCMLSIWKDFCYFLV